MMQRKVAVALLAGFYPAIFFLSNNWHIFSIPQSVVLLVGTSLVSLVILLPASYLFDRVFRKLTGKKSPDDEPPDGRSAFFDASLTVCALLFCTFLLRNTLLSIDIHRGVLVVIIAAVFLSFAWVSYKKGLKPILYAFAILSSLSIAGFFLSVYTKTSIPIEDWTTKNKAQYSKITFRKTPNVHLIVTESYPNKDALKAVYGFDNTSFYEKMKGLGIKINHDYFSNYNQTLASLPSLFGMEHHYGVISLANFDSLGGRRMLEARVYNPVMDIFRANGYKIQFLHAVSALIPYGADVDFCMPSPTLFHGLKIFLVKQDLLDPTLAGGEGSASLSSIQRQIAAASQGKTPCFNFIYVNFPGHSSSRTTVKSDQIINEKLGEFRDEYGEIIESANIKLLALFNFIIAKDPDSIIVVIGDHGSWGFRSGEDRHGNAVSNRLFVLDRYGVLAGLRGPDALSGLMEDGTIKSHVNLFRYIFAYLSEDPTILATKAPDDSYGRPFMQTIKDGNILDRFVDVQSSVMGNGSGKKGARLDSE